MLGMIGVRVMVMVVVSAVSCVFGRAGAQFRKGHQQPMLGMRQRLQHERQRRQQQAMQRPTAKAGYTIHYPSTITAEPAGLDAEFRVERIPACQHR